MAALATAPLPKKRRRPISVSTHTEPTPDPDEAIDVVTTLVFDDGTVWRKRLTRDWYQIYALGDEEPDEKRESP